MDPQATAPKAGIKRIRVASAEQPGQQRIQRRLIDGSPARVRTADDQMEFVAE
jgi:hypothetical protein